MRTALIVTNDYREMSHKAACIVAEQILTKQDCVLGLPTGQTPVGLYALLVTFYEQRLLDFSHVTAFNLDEFCGVSANKRTSYAYFMRTHLFNHVNIPPRNVHLLNGRASDTSDECRRYEEELSRFGGIDLLILGLGPNGHIGFNEPGTDWATTTHRATLSQETRQREANRFGNLGNTPTEGLTMGVKTIMNARGLLLLVSGKAKAEILAAALAGPITRDIPASVLQLHPNLTTIADQEAADILIQSSKDRRMLQNRILMKRIE